MVLANLKVTDAGCPRHLCYKATMMNERNGGGGAEWICFPSGSASEVQHFNRSLGGSSWGRNFGVVLPTF